MWDEGLLAAIGRREYTKNGESTIARTLTLVDQVTGGVRTFDVDDRRVNGELDEHLHRLVRLDLSYGVYWNDVPGSPGVRRPSTVVKVIGCSGFDRATGELAAA